jgi:hypothetical protein
LVGGSLVLGLAAVPLLLKESPAAAASAARAHTAISATETPDYAAALSSVSCVWAGNCGVVDSHQDGAGNFRGLLLTTSGTWGTGTQASLAANASGSVDPSSIFCSAATNCSAVGSAYLDGSVETLSTSPSQTTLSGAPTGLTAIAGDTAVALSWSAPSNNGGSAVEGYDVYEGTSSGGESTTSLNSTLITTTSYTAAGLTNGTKYYFVVKAVDAPGSSAASNEASATPRQTNPCVSYTGDEAFICSAYEDLLGHAPDPGGLSYWSAQLAAGVGRASVAFGIGTSTEYRIDLVSGYYKDFLGRAPEAAELSYWVAKLDNGASDQAVLSSVLGSGEFYADSGGTPGDFVTALYAKLLGRTPDPGGLSFWEDQLSSGVTQSAVAAGILSSTEYEMKCVDAMYLSLLGRGADPAGMSYWVGQLAGGASNESVISGIIGSPEFYGSCPVKWWRFDLRPAEF